MCIFHLHAAIEDFTPVSLSVTFAPTDTLQFVTIPINDDFSVEVEEYFSVLLSNGTLQLDNTTIFIEDNDCKSTAFSKRKHLYVYMNIIHT